MNSYVGSFLVCGWNPPQLHWIEEPRFYRQTHVIKTYWFLPVVYNRSRNIRINQILPCKCLCIKRRRLLKAHSRRVTHSKIINVRTACHMNHPIPCALKGSIESDKSSCVRHTILRLLGESCGSLVPHCYVLSRKPFGFFTTSYEQQGRPMYGYTWTMTLYIMTRV